MTRRSVYGAAVLAAALLSQPALAFCGFYVAKADTKLFNKASQVVLVRDGDKTVLTMANDYQGPPKEFAVVIPVPTAITREQIHIGDKALLDHLDAYTSPRLVEYHDPDPCEPESEFTFYSAAPPPASKRPAGGSAAERAAALGVKIEAQYTVGEYDILILSATQSKGLETWLRESGYRIPDGASEVLGSYIGQNMKFFVAKVNLGQQEKLGFRYLRPIQVAYESPKFMLPIRLGTVNADGPQELFIYTLTRKGRVESTNYRSVKLPSDLDVPVYVKDQFGDFYKAMFNEQVKKHEMRAVFTEYAWDMGWCDPCAADPLSASELRNLGVFWLDDTDVQPTPMPNRRPAPTMRGGAQDVYVTRLHVRYDRARFPDDLVFQETGDRQNFQGRYILRHPFAGPMQCKQADGYRANVRKRQEKEAENLAMLTGWSVADIRKTMKLDATGAQDKKWYKKIWKD
jgi:hypothetical protein